MCHMKRLIYVRPRVFDPLCLSFPLLFCVCKVLVKLQQGVRSVSYVVVNQSQVTLSGNKGNLLTKHSLKFIQTNLDNTHTHSERELSSEGCAVHILGGTSCLSLWLWQRQRRLNQSSGISSAARAGEELFHLGEIPPRASRDDRPPLLPITMSFVLYYI